MLSTTGSLASTLGTVQPFRYRGYVYDVETGFYYLRARYYNPIWNRFINADSIVKDNLFIYCLGNPVCYIDKNGEYPDISYMMSMKAIHDSVVERVRDAVTGGMMRYLDTGIPGAGRGGGWGYPDVIDNSGHAREVKPLTPYGIFSGARQIKKYTTNTRYTRGYPVDIQPFRAKLLEQEGTVLVLNGMILDFDYGVVYYLFIPDAEKQPELEHQAELKPAYVQQPAYGNQQPAVVNDDNIWKTILLAAVFGISLVSPIPGDEVLAAAALVGAF